MPPPIPCRSHIFDASHLRFIRGPLHRNIMIYMGRRCVWHSTTMPWASTLYRSVEPAGGVFGPVSGPQEPRTNSGQVDAHHTHKPSTHREPSTHRDQQWTLLLLTLVHSDTDGALARHVSSSSRTQHGGTLPTVVPGAGAIHPQLLAHVHAHAAHAVINTNKYPVPRGSYHLM